MKSNTRKANRNAESGTLALKNASTSLSTVGLYEANGFDSARVDLVVEVVDALLGVCDDGRIEALVLLVGLGGLVVKVFVEGEHVGEEVGVAVDAARGEALRRPLHKVAKGHIVDFHL